MSWLADGHTSSTPSRQHIQGLSNSSSRSCSHMYKQRGTWKKPERGKQKLQEETHLLLLVGIKGLPTFKGTSFEVQGHFSLLRQVPEPLTTLGVRKLWNDALPSSSSYLLCKLYLPAGPMGLKCQKCHITLTTERQWPASRQCHSLDYSQSFIADTIANWLPTYLVTVMLHFFLIFIVI